MLHSRSRRGLAITAQEELQKEILQLTQIIANNLAAMRRPSVSDSDKAS